MTTAIAHLYRPADAGWLALCRADLVLGVDLAPDDVRADALWTLVTAGSGTAELLDELTRGGISATPSFVLVDRTARSRARVLVRGDARVLVGAAEVDGRQSSGWAESSGTSKDQIVVEIAGEGAAELPIVHGAVRISRIATGPAASASAAPAAPVEKPADAAARVPIDATISATTVVELVDDPPAAPADPGRAPAPAVEGTGYDHLFGETMYRSVEDAAVRAPDDTAGPAAEPDDRIDERTVVAADLAAARANRRAARRKQAPEPAAPRLHLMLSNGGREALDRPLVIGRAPSAERVSDGNVPRLVSMTTPNQDISRTHVQVAVEGGTVVVTDLHSRNGTMVQLPGKAPQQLRAGEPTPVTVGTVIDLGDGATLTVGEDS
jgi:hypothetical protein